MAHFTADTKAGKTTPREWLAFGAQANDVVNKYASRDDLVTKVGPDAAVDSGAPACFKPMIAEIEINTDLAIGVKHNPKFVGDITDRSIQFEYPVLMGAILHEAMHAKHSLWDLEAVGRHEDQNVSRIITVFEETRIEARGVQAFRHDKTFLRACALKLVMADTMEKGDDGEYKFKDASVMGFSQLILLTLARVDAGVLKKKDIKPIAAAAEDKFGAPLMLKLQDIWKRAQAHRKDNEWKPLEKLAIEWLELLKSEGHEPEQPMEIRIMVSLAGEMEDQADETETDAHVDGVIELRAEDLEAMAAAAKEAAAESKDHKEEAQDVFGRDTGPSPSDSTRSRLVEKRAPTGPERAAAVTVSKLLEKAKYRDRVIIERSSVVPPGRLRGRAAVQGAADRARGVQTHAEPWKRKQRFQTEDPELKIGVMVDISGSMSSAMEPMAVTAWMLSEACRRIQAKACMTYFGDSVFPVLKTGQHLDQVHVYSAPDGSEKFAKAFKATDGVLNLLHGTGARLLIIVSDMVHQGHEQAAAKRYFKRCRQAGVAVVIIPMTGRNGSGSWDNHVDQYKDMVSIVKVDPKPTEVALAIGKAAVAEIEKVNARR